MQAGDFIKAEEHYREALRLINAEPKAVEKMLAGFHEGVEALKMEKAMGDLSDAIDAGLVDERKLESLAKTFEMNDPSEEQIENAVRNLLTS